MISESINSDMNVISESIKSDVQVISESIKSDVQVISESFDLYKFSLLYTLLITVYAFSSLLFCFE